MKALITGASSGIGRDMAIVLSEMGCELILAARREDRLNELKEQLPTVAEVIAVDLSKREGCFALYERVKDCDIDILINNAGFGVFGEFAETELDSELEMLDTNVAAVHILTKLFVGDFKRKNSGYILNVASSAGFLPGPLMAAYYAGKGYVLRLTQAVSEELKKSGSAVYIGALCPGPVGTEFEERAKVSFSVKALSSRAVAEYAVRMMFRRKTVIVPGLIMKCSRILSKILPDKILLLAAYNIQHSKK